jgi:putative ABC transport system permease protein
MLTVDPRYFETVRLAILRGRGFTDVDGSAGRESAIVNTRFAQMFFPKEDPIGRRIVLNMDLAGGAPPSGGIPTSLTATIVGIVPNVRQRNFNEPETDPVAYLPYRTDPRGFMNLLARTDGDPAAVTSLIREELRQVDADLPLFNIRTMDDNLARQRWPFRVFGIMFGAFAFIALVLSAVGLYAVTAYSVTQRTQEIGVRTALGAAPTNVMWLFMRRALVHLGIGLTIGMAAALGVGKIFESTQLLVRMSGRDPITIASIATVLAIVAITASIVPARRATQLDPLVALRGE